VTGNSDHKANGNSVHAEHWNRLPGFGAVRRSIVIGESLCLRGVGRFSASRNRRKNRSAKDFEAIGNSSGNCNARVAGIGSGGAYHNHRDWESQTNISSALGRIRPEAACRHTGDH